MSISSEIMSSLFSFHLTWHSFNLVIFFMAKVACAIVSCFNIFEAKF